jgi:putative endonuclease
MAEKKEYHFWVYIAASRCHQTYIGVTNSRERRMREHSAAPEGSYTARYRIDRLVYFEHYKYIHDAVAREKELRDWNRSRKIALIEAVNPTWQDLFEDLGESLRRFWG